eukprot:TRINITY_DN4711_c0_g1_i8.p1 TRINITY_DN4711_c0_g1~~TRINITY_DN4711_c0_g1_i8.p1  ORF type:complete len:269 (+),score=78.46 TRINITY_DN4711_c0_g1_i8:168-974(+)
MLRSLVGSEMCIRDRLVFKLHDDLAPLACANFRALCTGEKGEESTAWGPKKLCYAETAIHKMGVGSAGEAVCLFGGDVEHGDGSGGLSIYGKPFFDENNALSTDLPGVLSTLNTRPDSNTSLFSLVLTTAPHLAKAGAVSFGTLVSQNPSDALQQLTQVPHVDGAPVEPLVIAQCGVQSLQASGEPGEDGGAGVDLDDLDDHQLRELVHQKSKRAREDNVQALSSVRSAVAAGLIKEKKTKQEVVQVPAACDEPEDEDVDLLGDVGFD